MGRTILRDLLAQPAMPECFLLVHSIGNWAPTKVSGFPEEARACFNRAVNQQQAPSAKLCPATALLGLDLFYLKEPFEAGLFMQVALTW